MSVGIVIGLFVGIVIAFFLRVFIEAIRNPGMAFMIISGVVGLMGFAYLVLGLPLSL